MIDKYICQKCSRATWRLIRGEMCGSCYSRLQRSPDWKPLPKPTVRERLLSHLIIDPSGCLLWDGHTTDDGYGRIKAHGRMESVHILMWEMFEGSVPEGLELDHVKANGCTNRHCASIAHLEPVTHRENNLRGTSPSAECARKTHCDKGHEFTRSNTYIQASGGRACRKCMRAGDAQRRAEAKALREAGAVLLAALFAIRSAWADGYRAGRSDAEVDHVLAQPTETEHFASVMSAVGDPAQDRSLAFAAALLAGELREPAGEDVTS